MAVAELITTGTSEAPSADFTLAAGDAATIFLKDAAGPSTTADANIVAKIQIKSAGAEYFDIGELNRNAVALVLSAPGTYRVLRLATSIAFGVDRY